MNGTTRQYRKRPTNDMGLVVSSTGVETRISEDICFSFSVSDTEAESNFSDCFDLSHEKRLGDLSCSLEASADMRDTMGGADKRRKRYCEGKHMYRPTWRISISRKKGVLIDPNLLTLLRCRPGQQVRVL
jgi:hypothetical protein